MATIKQYQPSVSVEAPLPGRSPERLYAEPEDFGGGQGLPTLARGAQSASDVLYDAAQRDETSSVETNLAKMRSKWTMELQKRASSSAVDDPNFVQNFSEEVQNDLTGYGANLNTRAGQQAFARGSAELTATMLTNANATAIHAAGARTKNAAAETINANINTLNLDPTQFPSILADTEASLNDPNGPYATMPAEARTALDTMAKEQYAFATARAYIRQNPQAALDAFNQGKLPGQQYLKNQAGSQVVELANSAINASRIKRIQQDADMERQRRIGAEDAGRSIFDSFLKNPGDTTLADKVLNDQNMTWQEKNSLLGAMGRSAKPMADHDLSTYGDGFYDVYHAIGNGATYTQKQLFDMVGPRPDANGNMVDGPLTAAGVDKVIALQQSKRTPEGSAEAAMVTSALAAAKGSLTYEIPGMPGKDPVGQQKYAMFLQQFLPAFDAAKQGGKSPQELLNFDDPKSLISTTMQRYKRDIGQMMKDRTDAMTVGMAPAGATDMAYDKSHDPVYNVGGKWQYGDGREYKP